MSLLCTFERLIEAELATLWFGQQKLSQFEVQGDRALHSLLTDFRITEVLVTNQVDTRFISAGADVHSCQLLGIPSVELTLAQQFEHSTRCLFVLPKRLRASTQISVKMFDKAGTLLYTSKQVEIYPEPVIVSATPPSLIGSEATTLELQVRFGDILHTKH